VPVNTAASLFMRHAAAYGELIAEELGVAYAGFVRRLWAGVVLAAAGVFAIAMACVWAIAATWSTPGRMWLIAGLFAAFMLISVAALWFLRAPRNRMPLLAGTAFEWRKDRLLLNDLLAQSSVKSES
jgi:uncharacterized membrane protein YqjE